MEKFVGYLGLFMSVFFVFVGVFIIWKQPLNVPAYFSSLQSNPSVFHFILGGMLMAYGIFRFVRAYKMVTNNKTQ